MTSSDPRFITKDRSNKIGNGTDADFGVWVEKVKAIKIGDQKVVHDDAIVQDEKPQDDQPVAPVDKVPTTTIETPKEAETQPIQANPVTPTRLPANKVKQVQIKWREFAEKNTWNTTDSGTKRKATMQKYYGVTSANDLTVDQADDFVQRIDQAIKK
jgi:hypothetical protein